MNRMGERRVLAASRNHVAVRARRRDYGVPAFPTPRGAPKVSMRAMRQAYSTAFGEPLPRGWAVRFGVMEGALGRCSYMTKEVILSAHYCGSKPWGSPMRTLMHEFVHVRLPHLRHGDEFDGIVEAACREVGLV